MDYIVITLFIVWTSGFTVFIAFDEAREWVKARKAPQATAEIETPAPVGWGCEQYAQRLLEEKLVAAGAMQTHEMTVCDDSNCKNCAETHRQIEREQRHSAPAGSTDEMLDFLSQLHDLCPHMEEVITVDQLLGGAVVINRCADCRRPTFYNPQLH